MGVGGRGPALGTVMIWGGLPRPEGRRVEPLGEERPSLGELGR